MHFDWFASDGFDATSKQPSFIGSSVCGVGVQAGFYGCSQVRFWIYKAPLTFSCRVTVTQ